VAAHWEDKHKDDCLGQNEVFSLSLRDELCISWIHGGTPNMLYQASVKASELLQHSWLMGFFGAVTSLCKLFQKSWRQKDGGELGLEPQSSRQQPQCLFPISLHVHFLRNSFNHWVLWLIERNVPFTTIHPSSSFTWISQQGLKMERLSLFLCTWKITWWSSDWQGQGSPHCQVIPATEMHLYCVRYTDNSLVSHYIGSGFWPVKQICQSGWMCDQLWRSSSWGWRTTGCTS
jgi:hypothetical protein